MREKHGIMIYTIWCGCVVDWCWGPHEEHGRRALRIERWKLSSKRLRWTKEIMISLWLYNLSKLNILLLVHVLILLQKVLEKKNQNRRLNETFLSQCRFNSSNRGRFQAVKITNLHDELVDKDSPVPFSPWTQTLTKHSNSKIRTA